MRLVFQPGFSTREQATDVSGRGIGLDVVTQLTEQLGGSVRVENQPGRGCRFVMTMPVSLALTQVLLAEAGGRTFALPAVSVESALRAPADAARPSGEGHALPVGGALTPLVDLAALLGLPAGHAADEDLNVAVVESGGLRLALRVSKFVGQRSVVVAALDPFLAGVKVVSGTAELEGGRRVLLLSVPEIFKLSSRGMIGRHRDEAARRKRVLIVDDSPVIREVMAPILERLGYEVLEAGNGREGFDRACSDLPDLVMTDVEMPILDGFGLIEKLRSADAVRRVPVVVLSTRGAEADKRRAMQAGANAYLVKTSFDEGELSRTLRSLLS
ncbi:MAG: response regulator [Myxococcales bacterium]